MIRGALVAGKPGILGQQADDARSEAHRRLSAPVSRWPG